MPHVGSTYFEYVNEETEIKAGDTLLRIAKLCIPKVPIDEVIVTRVKCLSQAHPYKRIYVMDKDGSESEFVCGVFTTHDAYVSCLAVPNDCSEVA